MNLSDFLDEKDCENINKQNLLHLVNKFGKIRKNSEFVKHVVSSTIIAQYFVEKYYQYPANL